MPLTPADIHNTVFTKSPIGKRGYDEEQVDALLDEVSAEMIALLEESDALQRRAGHSTSSEFADDVDMSDGFEFATVAAELRRAAEERDRAERAATALRSELEATRRSVEAQSAAPVIQLTDKVLARAHATADGHVLESQQESVELLAKARDQADRTIQDARASGLALTDDAQRRHAEAMATVQSARAALQSEIDGLTRLAASYHAALRQHLNHQEKLVDGQAAAD